MTEPDETTCEQLSAWMDGALTAEEARFLERRLQHDAALRAKWERMQLASSCLRGHEVRPMPGLAERVAAAIDAAPATARPARPWLGWAIAASVAALAIAFVPKMLTTPQPAPLATIEPSTPDMIASPEPMPATPTPGSADFIAQVPVPAAPRAPVAAPTDATAPPTPDAAIVATSPEDFPLVDTARSTSWPRPGLPGSDAAMEGYLVRHNEMAGADALGGFVPYLDVVAAGEPQAVPDPKDDKR